MVELVVETFFGGEAKWNIIIGTGVLLLVTAMAMIGAESYGKINRFLWGGQLLTIWITFACILFTKGGYVLVSHAWG